MLRGRRCEDTALVPRVTAAPSLRHLPAPHRASSRPAAPGAVEARRSNATRPAVAVVDDARGEERAARRRGATRWGASSPRPRRAPPSPPPRRPQSPAAVTAGRLRWGATPVAPPRALGGAAVPSEGAGRGNDAARRLRALEAPLRAAPGCAGGRRGDVAADDARRLRATVRGEGARGDGAVARTRGERRRESGTVGSGGVRKGAMREGAARCLTSGVVS